MNIFRLVCSTLKVIALVSQTKIERKSSTVKRSRPSASFGWRSGRLEVGCSLGPGHLDVESERWHWYGVLTSGPGLRLTFAAAPPAARYGSVSCSRAGTLADPHRSVYTIPATYVGGFSRMVRQQTLVLFRAGTLVSFASSNRLHANSAARGQERDAGINPPEEIHDPRAVAYTLAAHDCLIGRH